MYEDAHLEIEFEDRVSGFDPIGGYPMEDDALIGSYVPSMYESEWDEFDPEDPDDPEGD